jgi:hypothetical protein
MIVTNVTRDVPIPHEEGQQAVIRKLSQTQLREAAKIRQAEGIGVMMEIGAELLKALREGDAAAAKRIEDAQAANINNYDRDTLLKHGLLSWTYPEPVSQYADLDEDTAAFLADAIFEFSRRRTADEQKNG